PSSTHHHPHRLAAERHACPTAPPLSRSGRPLPTPKQKEPCHEPVASRPDGRLRQPLQPVSPLEPSGRRAGPQLGATAGGPVRLAPGAIAPGETTEQPPAPRHRSLTDAGSPCVALPPGCRPAPRLIDHEP